MHQPFIYFGDYCKKFTGLLLDLSSFPLFLKTGITSPCFKQWGNSPLTRDWLRFWNINLEKMSSFIFISFTVISPSGQAFLELRVIYYIFHFVYWNKLETDRGNIFDFITSLIFVILGWFWYLNDTFLLDLRCFLFFVCNIYFVLCWALAHFHQNIF